MRGIHELVETYGAKNIRVFIPMKGAIPLFNVGFTSIAVSNDTEVEQECVIEENRYKVDDKYKITFRAIGDMVLGEEVLDIYYGCKHYYQSDFDILRERYPEAYKVYVLVDEDNKYERVF